MVEIGEHSKHRRFAERLRPYLKQRSSSAMLAYLCESEMLDQLAVSKVAFVRGFESAPIDAAIICTDSTDAATLHLSPLQVWQWAIEQENVEFISVDVKSVGLVAGLGSTKGLDYIFTHPASVERFNKGDAEVFLVRFEALKGYTAIVPKAVWENASGVTYGINGLISGVPYIYGPFMVHDSDLHQAIQNLKNKDSVYVNPTTGGTLVGFKPKRTKRPPLIPTGHMQVRSMLALKTFWKTLSSTQSDVVADFNHVAPLICDFVLDVPTLPELLCIEHKHFHEPSEGTLYLSGPGGKYSPYSKIRMWHFLIYQRVSESKVPQYICFARNEVQEDWIEHPPTISSLPNPENTLFEGERAMQMMLRKIQQQGLTAIATVDQIVKNMIPEEHDITSFTTTRQIERALALEKVIEESTKQQLLYMDAEVSEIINDDELPSVHITRGGNTYTKPSGLSYNSLRLPWVCDELNQQCYKYGNMMCFPLDHGHPLGDHVLVEHRWTDTDRATFEHTRALPRHLFSPGMQDSNAIILRFADFSAPLPSWTPQPLWIRGRYWLKPAIEQHFIWLASTISGKNSSEVGSSYLMYPSEFTTMFDQGLRDAPSPVPHGGVGYFRSALMQDDRLPAPAFRVNDSGKRARPFDEQNGLVKKHAPQPLSCIIDLIDGSIYGHLLEIMEGHQQLVDIKNPQSASNVGAIDADLYRIKVGLIWETAWIYGLTRRVPVINRAQEVTDRRLASAGVVVYEH